MADFSQTAQFGDRRSVNPFVLHLQKLGLELKCAICLNLFNGPTLLPCDHIFCNGCIPRGTQFDFTCPFCNVQYRGPEIRQAPYLENVVAIYRNLDAAFAVNMCQPIDLGSERCTLSAKELNCKSSNDVDLHRLFPSLANKQIHVHFNNSTHDGPEKNEELDSSGIVTKRDKIIKLEGHGAVGIDIQVIAQSSLVRPSSCDDADSKSSDNGINGQGFNHNQEMHPAKRGVHEKYASESDDHGRQFKNQKKLNHEQLHMGLKINENAKTFVSESEPFISNSESEPHSSRPRAQLVTVPESSSLNKSLCAFCHLSKVSEATGPMMHFKNGIQVGGDEAQKPNVIHVHVKCFEWAPQVYYVGDKLENLEKEITRGSKLKCIKCGLKGAALGCYSETCRKSYHYPCALKVKGCRWDCDNFLVLCPAHSSTKFPTDKSKSRKSVIKNNHAPPQMTSEESNFWASLPVGAKEWVLCGSALSAKEMILVVKFANMMGITVCKVWKPNVTHVIAAKDVNGACTRTVKVLLAILHGRWVLTIDWVQECMRARQPVDEEPYEISLDNHGSKDGPKSGRLKILNNEPKLFDCLKFYFVGEFLMPSREELENLIVIGGGVLLKNMEMLEAQSCDVGEASSPSSILIVYHLPQECMFDKVLILGQRLNEAQHLATKFRSQVIGHTWILDSIAACKLQHVVN